MPLLYIQYFVQIDFLEKLLVDMVRLVKVRIPYCQQCFHGVFEKF